MLLAISSQAQNRKVVNRKQGTVTWLQIILLDYDLNSGDRSTLVIVSASVRFFAVLLIVEFVGSVCSI